MLRVLTVAASAAAVWVASKPAVAAFVVSPTYDSALTATNQVDGSARSAPFDVATFTPVVLTAYQSGFGGVVTFDDGGTFTSNTPTTGGVIDAQYGFSTVKTLRITASTPLESFTTSGVSSFSTISGARAIYPGVGTDRDSITSYSFTFGPVTDGVPNEAVTQVGITYLSRNAANFPKDVTLRANYSNGSNESATSTLNEARETDDTFYGFIAPAGASISSLQVTVSNPIGSTEGSAGVPFDDLGFVTAVVPEPASTGLLGCVALAGIRRRCRQQRRAGRI